MMNDRLIAKRDNALRLAALSRRSAERATGPLMRRHHEHKAAEWAALAETLSAEIRAAQFAAA